MNNIDYTLLNNIDYTLLNNILVPYAIVINVIFYTLISIPASYIISDILSNIYNLVFKKNISKYSIYIIWIIIIFCAFFKGYTNNDLVTNIKLLIF